MQLGDTVNLVRKYTGHVLDCELIEVLANRKTPCVVVRWKGHRDTFQLDVDKNLVLAMEASQRERHQMRIWWGISEEHRKELTELFWKTRKNGASNGRRT